MTTTLNNNDSIIFIPIVLATLRPDSVLPVDMYVSFETDERPQLYRDRSYPLSSDDLERLCHRGIGYRHAVDIKGGTTNQIALGFKLGIVRLGVEEGQYAFNLGHGFDADAVSGQQKQIMCRHVVEALVVFRSKQMIDLCYRAALPQASSGSSRMRFHRSRPAILSRRLGP